MPVIEVRAIARYFNKVIVDHMRFDTDKLSDFPEDLQVDRRTDTEQDLRTTSIHKPTYPTRLKHDAPINLNSR